jgi:DNA-directed RNA polymerase specialized sigma24 family protein
VSARLPSLHRLALVLSQDQSSADDLVQAAVTKLYVHWGRARAADHPDAYARAILVREFLHERRSSWARGVRLVLRFYCDLNVEQCAQVLACSTESPLVPRLRALFEQLASCDAAPRVNLALARSRGRRGGDGASPRRRGQL